MNLQGKEHRLIPPTGSNDSSKNETFVYSLFLLGLLIIYHFLCRNIIFIYMRNKTFSLQTVAKKMLQLCLTGAILLGFAACKQKQSEPSVVQNEEVQTEEKLLSPLEAGEVFCKDKNPFGETIELTGENIETDSVIFKVSETRMLVRDNCLIVKNRYGEQPFMRFELPSMKLLGFSGRMGSGPDEFVSPTLCPSTDPDCLCYALELSNQKMYRYEKDGQLVYENIKLTEGSPKNDFSLEAAQIAPGDFMYVRNSKSGKSIFRSTQTGDSVSVREVFSLGLNPKRTSWTSYIGDFVANPKQNRMAYAYKYFKMIKFMDLEGETVRTINFEKEEFDESTTYKIDGLDQNVTHYWGACAGEEYVYFLYSGRTPVTVGREISKQQCYIFVEQYDWNGNPIHRYRLDRWGYFTVDEKNKQIYIASTSDDDPFFVFRLADE